jgi:hypothetical protein
MEDAVQRWLEWETSFPDTPRPSQRQLIKDENLKRTAFRDRIKGQVNSNLNFLNSKAIILDSLKNN